MIIEAFFFIIETKQFFKTIFKKQLKTSKIEQTELFV
jgi:hypothetical protein